ncbi:extracellular solute-binding protein [Actinomyces sp. F1_1611]
MKIKQAAIGIVGASLALGLAGCGGSNSGDQSGASGGKSGSSERANQMYTWVSNESDREQWETFISGVQENGDPDFSITLEGPTFQEYWTLAKTRMAASDAPCILTTQAARAQELGSLLAPLDDLAKEAGLDLGQYNQAMMQGMTVDGTVRAIPYDAEPMLMYFNRDMFKAAGLEDPSVNYTTEQFISDAKALTDGDVYGTSVGPDLTYPYLPFSFANGHAPVKDGELDLTNPDFVKDVQQVMDMVSVDGISSAPNPSDNDEVSRQNFLAGKIGIIVDGPWFYSTIKDGASFDVGIAVPPSNSGDSIGLIQGSGFGIAESCPDKEAAFANIMKMTTPEVVGYVGEHRGTVPSIDSALDAWATGKPEADVEVVKALLANGLPLVTTPTWNQVVTQFQQYSPEGARGDRTAQDILESIEKSVG